MTAKRTENEPMEVQVVQDDVVILGPDGIGASLSAPAALESARRLGNAARVVAAGHGDVRNDTEDDAPEDESPPPR